MRTLRQREVGQPPRGGRAYECRVGHKPGHLPCWIHTYLLLLLVLSKYLTNRQQWFKRSWLFYLRYVSGMQALLWAPIQNPRIFLVTSELMSCSTTHLLTVVHLVAR
jgi:hypothetical protein